MDKGTPDILAQVIILKFTDERITSEGFYPKRIYDRSLLFSCNKIVATVSQAPSAPVTRKPTETRTCIKLHSRPTLSSDFKKLFVERPHVASSFALEGRQYCEYAGRYT
jgi:hypothetical protein